MSALTWERRVCDVRSLAKVPKGFDALADRIGGAWRRRGAMSRLQADAGQVERIGKEGAHLSDEVLRRRLEETGARFRRGRKLDDADLFAALALVREAAFRTVGMRPFPVQLMGALALRRGLLAEMATGEGKSLTAALAAVLAGWSGLPCHVVTVNDYLAERDAEKFRPLYEFCGLEVGAVTGPMQAPDRTRGHAAHITYTTSKELAADFLRDRLCLGPVANAIRWNIRLLQNPRDPSRDGVVMRGLHTAIVDEADSVLIDEAVTPLIIAGSENGAGADEAFQQAWALAAALAPGTDFLVHERFREVELLPDGRQKVAAFGADLPALWRSAARKQELVLQALNAREFFHAGKQYVVENGEVVIVDEFTGRLMPMRKWRHGLHQAVEAKEGVEISGLDETLARISFQRFFRQFRHLSGMSGTAAEAAAEFWQIYRLPAVRIPTNRPSLRNDLPDRLFADEEEKLRAVADEIARRHAAGQPLLVGARSVAASEGLAARLRGQGMEVEVLNASRHAEEARIVERAGECGRITIATNMAGRGTDIVLGAGAASAGGLHVIATERHESRRIDRQLYGRAGRQGDPGSAQAFVSADDELLRRHGTDAARRLVKAAAAGRVPCGGALARAVFAQAQAAAQWRAFRQRQQVLQQDDWLDEALSFAPTR